MKQSAAGRTRCPHCGASIDSNEQNCWICGAELNANAHGAGGKPSAAKSVSAAPPQTPPAPRPQPESGSVTEPNAPSGSVVAASQATASSTASSTASAPKAQPNPTAPHAAARGSAKPSQAKRAGPTKPRAYPKMSVPRNLSDRRDQRAWLLAIPLLAVLASFVYFNDPFKLRASPAAEPVAATSTQLIMTVVVLRAAPTQSTPVASATQVPAPTDTSMQPPTATASAEPSATPAPVTATVASTTAKSTPTAIPTRAPSTATRTPAVPTSTPRPPTVTPTASLVPGPGPNGTWVVARGDTCARIASQAGVSVEALVQANALQSNCFLRAGQVLIIPTPGPVAATAAATLTARPTTTPLPTVEPPATRTAAPAPNTATPLPTIGPPAAQTAAATTAAINGKRSYTVKAGDSCFRIARAENVAVEDLIRANNLDARCFLSVGRTLTLP